MQEDTRSYSSHLAVFCTQSQTFLYSTQPDHYPLVTTILPFSLTDSIHLASRHEQEHAMCLAYVILSQTAAALLLGFDRVSTVQMAVI